MTDATIHEAGNRTSGWTTPELTELSSAPLVKTPPRWGWSRDAGVRWGARAWLGGDAMRARLVGISVVAFAVLACGTEAPVSPSRGLTVAGRVLDYAGGDGVAGAMVVFGAATQADARGAYMVTLNAGAYFPTVNGVAVGEALVRGPGYRGDLFVNGGTCISRYGTIADARTQQPVAGATVSLNGHEATTGADGWYRLDLGCPAEDLSFSTTFINVTHPGHAPLTRVVGRGVHGVLRLDLGLERP